MARAKAIERRREAALEEKKLLLKNLERREELKLVQLPFYAERLAELRNIRIAYGARTVCDSFGLSVRAGERIALQGPNGCGKSSILHLLCGMDVPHGGEVRRGSGLRISFVGQNTSGLCGSAAELIREKEIDESRFYSILNKLDVPKASWSATCGCSARDSGKRCCWRLRSASGHTCMSGMSRSTISM